jgi:hypothetical protein
VKAVFRHRQQLAALSPFLALALDDLVGAINTLPDHTPTLRWTPSVTFAVPGNLAVTYTTRVGTYDRIGHLVRLNFNIITSGFTHTSAFGSLQIIGLPFPALTLVGNRSVGAVFWGGITMAGYTQLNPSLDSNVSAIDFVKSGSGAVPGAITTTEAPTGAAIILRGSLTYQIAS